MIKLRILLNKGLFVVLSLMLVLTLLLISCSDDLTGPQLNDNEDEEEGDNDPGNGDPNKVGSEGESLKIEVKSLI